MKEEYQLILIDWDGVICDSLPIFYRLYSACFPQHGLDIGAFRSLIAQLNQDNLPILPGKLMDYRESFLQAELFPAVLNALHHLKTKGKKLCVVSTAPYEFIATKLKKHNFTDLFDEIFCSESNLKKPNTALIGYIETRFQIPESNTVFVGDQVGDLLFVRDTAYLKYFSAYGFHDLLDLRQTVKDNQIRKVTYFQNSRDLSKALCQL